MTVAPAGVRRLLRRFASRVAVAVPPPSGLWFFTFHSVGDGANPTIQPERDELTPRQFEAALAWITRRFTVIPCTEALALARRGAPPGTRLAVLTVDDGFRDFVDHAMPILRRFGVPVSLFVNSAMAAGEELAWRHRVVYLQRRFADALSADEREFLAFSKVRFAYPDTVARLDTIWRRHVDRDHERDLACRVYAGWDDLAATQAAHPAPVAIGNHTVHHWVLSRLADEVLRNEIGGCRDALAARFDVRSPFLAIPHGRPGDSSPAVHEVSSELGYVPFFTRGYCRPGDRLYPLQPIPRVDVTLRRPAPLAVLEYRLRRAGGEAIGRVQYGRYVLDQVRQTRAKRHKDARFRLVPFVEIVRSCCPDLRSDAPILCVGPRNEIELDVFAAAGFTNVTGIDLYSRSPRVRRMDMHDMKFPDAIFDVVFGSHVFEHAWDFGRLAHEVVRVLRPGGRVFCAVPRGGEPNWHDRYCFETPDEILAYFREARPEVLYLETRPHELRLLFRVSR